MNSDVYITEEEHIFLRGEMPVLSWLNPRVYSFLRNFWYMLVQGKVNVTLTWSFSLTLCASKQLPKCLNACRTGGAWLTELCGGYLVILRCSFSNKTNFREGVPVARMLLLCPASLPVKASFPWELMSTSN